MQQGARVMKGVFIVLAAALLLEGCAPAAMSAKEYREQIQKSYPRYHETHQVNRSASEVGASFKRKAKECLNYDMQSTSKSAITGTHTRVVSSSKSYVTSSGGRYSMIMQVLRPGNPLKGPKDGYYELLVDASPVGANKTRIDIYTSMSDMYKQAILSWAKGDERGCPDPMRRYELW